jgi:hypothetical protein
MECETVFECDNAQIAVQLRNKDPVADSAVAFLYLLPERVLQSGEAPLKLDVGALDEDIPSKIIGHRMVGAHGAIPVGSRLLGGAYPGEDVSSRFQTQGA